MLGIKEKVFENIKLGESIVFRCKFDIIKLRMFVCWNKEIDNINSSLINKANKNEVFSMANMGQDIKEAMTGGSVAIVGENSTDIVN